MPAKHSLAAVIMRMTPKMTVYISSLAIIIIMISIHRINGLELKVVIPDDTPNVLKKEADSNIESIDEKPENEKIHATAATRVICIVI